jgi:nicotinate-nucleotide pyrophosphorylase (carboxylating)
VTPTPPRNRLANMPVDDVALELIDLALDEDRGPGDWTTRWTVPARTRVHAGIYAKADGVIAGVALAAAVFLRLDARADIEVIAGDGARVAIGEPVMRIRGPGRAVLTGERVALNFLQRLSGVATLTRRFVDAVDGTGARILDTRKTTPGWRALEKAAVRAGGGENHRAGLYDAVLIKENHADIAGGVGEALRRVREQNTRRLSVIGRDAHGRRSRGGARGRRGQTPAGQLRHGDHRARWWRGCTASSRGRPLEASGNMSLERVREVALTGVDFISVGAHNAFGAGLRSVAAHRAPLMDGVAQPRRLARAHRRGVARPVAAARSPHPRQHPLHQRRRSRPRRYRRARRHRSSSPSTRAPAADACGREWQDRPGMSLLFSVLLRPVAHRDPAPGTAPLRIGLALARALRRGERRRNPAEMAERSRRAMTARWPAYCARPPPRAGR